MAAPTKKTLNLPSFYFVLKIGRSGRAVQKRALAQGRVTIYRIDKALGDGFGIQAEKLGELPHSFAMRQADDDGASIGWHPHKRDPFHVLYTHDLGRSGSVTSPVFKNFFCRA